MTATLATTYELRVAGHLDHHWSEALGDLVIGHHPDGTCTLTGPVADQAQLHGILRGLQSIGATLLALRPLQAVPDHTAGLDWPLETRRLSVRRARPEDADPTWRFRRLEEVGRWLTEVPEDRDAYRAAFRQPGRLATTLVIEREGEVIGDLMVRVEDAWAQAEVAGDAVGTQAELGWVLEPRYSGAGYATEAVGALLGVCFDGLGLRRVTASCFTANTASWQLMERLGMRRELHAVRDALHRSGTWQSTYGYALLRDEWAAASAS